MQVHRRTIMRDLTERFTFLPLNVNQGIYSLEPSFLGKFDLEDINRFAKFASIQVYLARLTNSFFKYLRASWLKALLTKKSVTSKLNLNWLAKPFYNNIICSFYQRVQKKQGDTNVAFEVEPYKLTINNNGVWYLIALHDNKVQVFSFTRISLPKSSNHNFWP